MANKFLGEIEPFPLVRTIDSHCVQSLFQQLAKCLLQIAAADKKETAVAFAKLDDYLPCRSEDLAHQLYLPVFLYSIILIDTQLVYSKPL